MQTRFLSQPFSGKAFGNVLNDELVSGRWTQLTIFGRPVGNTEAALEIEGGAHEEVFEEIEDAITHWRDDALLSRALDTHLLLELEKQGYIKPEKALGREPPPGLPGGKSTSAKPLFGYVPVAAPKISVATGPAPKSAAAAAKKQAAIPEASGHQLVLRVRLSRGTQAQIPIKLRATDFLAGVDELISLRDGKKHALHAAKPKGATKANTIKVEIPDASDAQDPILLLNRAGNAITYEIFDRAKGIGPSIRRSVLPFRRSSVHHSASRTRECIRAHF